LTVERSQLLGVTALAVAIVAAAPSVYSPPDSPSSERQASAPQAAPPAQQPPAAPTPQVPGAVPPVPGAPPPPAVPASRKFTSDGGMIFNIIKPDKGPDFELVMAKVKEALAKSDNPKRKQMALGWRVFKGLEPGPGGNLVYVFWFDPPVKDEDYQITAILGEAFPNELQDLWSKFQACFVNGQVMLNLQQVVNMSPNAPAIPK
jgi:hypothetical protein